MLKQFIVQRIRFFIKKLLEFLYPELRNLHILRELKDVPFAALKNIIYQTKIGKNSKIYPPFSVNDCSIGDHTYVSRNSRISMASIGNFCSIGVNFLCGYGIHPLNGISTSPEFYSTMKPTGHTFSEKDKIVERKPVRIGNDVFIGMNVTVLDGVTIGDGAVIGAGAVVSKDIPPYAIAVGTPIRILKYRFSEDIIKKLKKIEWWNFSNEKLLNVESYFFEVDAFIEETLEENKEDSFQ